MTITQGAIPTAAIVSPAQLYDRAVAHYEKGEFQPAMAALYVALEKAPQNPMLWNLAAAVAKAMGKAEDAERFWQSAIALKPDYAEAWYNLGVLLQGLKRRDEAVNAYNRTLELDPKHVMALNNLGTLLQLRDDMDGAMDCYRRAVAANPRHAESHHNLGMAFEAVGRMEEALHSFERAVEVDKKYVSAHHKRGLTLKSLGRIDEAYAAFDLAIRFSSDKAQYYRSLAFCKVFQPGDPHLAEMEELEKQMDSLSEEAQTELNFALGKAYEDLGERKKSFDHYVAGNAGKRKTFVYDEVGEMSYFAKTKKAFTAELLKSRQGVGDPSRVPIFIIGMPRSGTSLLEQILASHPRVHGAGECEDFGVLSLAIRHPDGRQYLPDDVGLLEPDGLRQLGAEYVRRMQAKPNIKPGSDRITDKMPHNFIRAGFIPMVLPNAKIIHSCRDRVDTCLSGFSKLFVGDLPYNYDLGELGRYWLAYDDLMAHWRKVLPPGSMLEVNYEEVVDDVEGQARRILDFCELEWDDSVLDFYNTERRVLTASASQVRQPIYKTSVKKWKAYGDTLKPLLEALHVDPSA